MTATPHLDNLIEGDESLTLDVLPWQLAGNEYVIGAPSDGQATIADDVAEVHLTVDDDEAAEEGQDAAGFTVTRDSHGDMTVSLRVYVQLGGTAARGTDYAASGLNTVSGTTYYVIIQPNQASVSISFAPITDNLIEGEETITYSLLGPLLAGHDYTIGAPNSGGATLSDDVAVATITASDPAAAELGQDAGTFTVSRSSQGDTIASLRVYLQEGDETVTLTVLEPLLGGHDYLIGVPAEAEVTIEDLVDGIFEDSFEDLEP